jgi:hypothetical protein
MFVAGMYIIRFLMNERHQRLTQGRKFRYEDYRNGEPGSLAARNVIFLEAQRKKGR